MLTPDDKRVYFQRDHNDANIRYRAWIGDSPFDESGICVWACGEWGSPAEAARLRQSAVDELNKAIQTQNGFLNALAQE